MQDNWLYWSISIQSGNVQYTVHSAPLEMLWNECLIEISNQCQSERSICSEVVVISEFSNVTPCENIAIKRCNPECLGLVHDFWAPKSNGVHTD